MEIEVIEGEFGAVMYGTNPGELDRPRPCMLVVGSSFADGPNPMSSVLMAGGALGVVIAVRKDAPAGVKIGGAGETEDFPALGNDASVDSRMYR